MLFVHPCYCRRSGGEHLVSKVKKLKVPRRGMPCPPHNPFWVSWSCELLLGLSTALRWQPTCLLAPAPTGRKTTVSSGKSLWPSRDRCEHARAHILTCLLTRSLLTQCHTTYTHTSFSLSSVSPLSLLSLSSLSIMTWHTQTSRCGEVLFLFQCCVL